MSKRIMALYHPILTSMVWCSSSNAAENRLKIFSRDRIITAKYEDIVNDPEEQVGKLCQFLQVDIEPEVLDFETHNSSLLGSSSGILIGPGNIDEIVQSLLNILGSQNLATEIGRAARKRVQTDFEISHVTEKLYDLYNHSVEG